MQITVQDITKYQIALEDGTLLASIEDIILDPKKKQVIAFVVEHNNQFATKVVTIDQVKKIEGKKIIVSTKKAIQNAQDSVQPVTESEEQNKTIGQTIITEEGKKVGSLTDITFDPKTGEIKEVVAKKPPNETVPLKEKYVNSIGQDAVVIDKKAEEKSQKTSALSDITQNVEKELSNIKNVITGKK